tara:strand:+ start:1747 stop:2310 length:564 start_codon:yes stop_codon:yes gene_type:complete
MVKRNACVFISGQGSNLKNLILQSRNSTFPIKISLVVSDNKKANGLNYARINKIPYVFVNTKIKNYDNKILFYLKKYNITFICLAGYMKIISSILVKNYQKKIINIHPSLLPKYKGLNTFSRVLKNREKTTGCTVHYVNERLDNGKTILQKKIFIETSDNEEMLKKKTQKLEYRAFPEAIIQIFRNI